MRSDHISRSAAKAAIENALGRFADATITAQRVLDSLPAAEADGRWETLRKWLPVVAEDWDRAGMPQKKFAVAYIIDKMDQIDAVLAPPSTPAAEVAERPERPPMLLAKAIDYDHPVATEIWRWWIRFGVAGDPAHNPPWASQEDGAGSRYCAASEAFCAVDRTASDSRALAIYDNDISNSGPAAQLRGEG